MYRVHHILDAATSEVVTLCSKLLTPRQLMLLPKDQFVKVSLVNTTCQCLCW